MRILTLFVFIFVSFQLPLFGIEDIERKILSTNRKNFVFIRSSNEKKSEYKVYVFNSLLKKNNHLLDTYIRFSLDDFFKRIRWYNDDLVEINVTTGSPGNFSIFYSIKKNKKSDIIYFPLAIDSKDYLILVGQENAFISHIFEPSNEYILNENFADTAIVWLLFDKKGTYFDIEGNLHLSFTDRENTRIKKVIKKSTILEKVK